MVAGAIWEASALQTLAVVLLATAFPRGISRTNASTRHAGPSLPLRRRLGDWCLRQWGQRAWAQGTYTATLKRFQKFGSWTAIVLVALLRVQTLGCARSEE